MEMGLAAGEFAGAKQVAEMTLKDMEPRLGRQDVLLTPALISLAEAEKGLLQESEAEETLNRAIKILQLTAGDSREMASALDVLGQIYDDQNKQADAEVRLKRALEIRQKILSADDPRLEASFEHLAEHYRRTARSPDAESFQKQADAIREKDLLNLKEYVDKENGFRVQIPNSWSNRSLLLWSQVPGVVAGFLSADTNSGVLVQRLAGPPGADSPTIYESFGQTLSVATSEVAGEKNVSLSGLPARRLRLTFANGKQRLGDWVTLLVTRNQFWVLHVVGPEQAMSSPDTPESRAAQKIVDSFAFLDPAQQVIKAQAVAPPPPVQTITGDAEHCRRYQNRDVAMEILLPDGWRESAQTSPAYQEGTLVVLNGTGTMAVVILGREELEASPELYLKTLQNGLREGSENFRQISETKVVRAGHQGTRMVLITRETGIDYRTVLEVFSSGNEHCRVMARAPTEVFDRYAAVFDAMLESVQFLPVAGQPPADHLTPQVTTGPKP